MGPVKLKIKTRKREPDKTLHIDVVSLIKKVDIIIKLLVNTQVSSKYRSVFKGKGLEFEDYREYTPGDDSKSIDWKASVRSNQLLIKRYKEERDLDVYFLVNCSNSMIFGSTKKLKLEYAAEVAAAFSYLVLAAGDKAGLVMYSDKVRRIVPAGRGEKHFYIIMRNLVDRALYGGGANLREAVNFISSVTRERGLLVIISDFIGGGKEWDRAVKLAAVSFDVVGIMVRDPRDRALPEGTGNVAIEDPFSESTMIINPDNIREDFARKVKKDEEGIEAVFRGSGGDFISLTTDTGFTKSLIEFFIRRRMVLFK